MTHSVAAILLQKAVNSSLDTEVTLLIATANSAQLTCSSGAPTRACNQCQTEEWLAVAIDELTKTIVPCN